MEFDACERAYLNKMRMLTTDNAGSEIYVGLTVEESQEYHKLTRPDHRIDSEPRGRHQELYKKHEQARRAVLNAEGEARQDTSLRH